MKRRAFLQHVAGAALLAAVPVGGSAATRGSLLEEPTAWIGARFRLADGSRVALATVEQLGSDLYCTQLRLQFRVLSGSAPAEGTHVLASGWGEELLFLQPGTSGPVACINRLNRLA